MKRRTLIRSAVLLVVAAGVAWPVVAHFRLKGRLASYRRQLKAGGEKLTVAELTPPPSPEAFEAAQDLLHVASILRNQSPNWTNYPPTMRYAGPGKAVVCWKENRLPNTETANVWPGLHQDVTVNHLALEQIRLVLNAPAFAFDLDYRQGPSLMLPHLAQMKGIAQWLSSATILELHESAPTNAFENLIALTRLAQKQRDEPLLISCLVRVAISAIAANACWEALQSPECADGQLQVLQATWSQLDLWAQAEAALGMERAGAEVSFVQARGSSSIARNFFSASGSGSSGLSELTELGKEALENPQAGLKALFKRYPGYWIWRWWQSYDDELASAQITQAALQAVRQTRRQKCLGPALHQFEEEAARLQKAHPKAGTWMGYGVTEAPRRFLQRLALIEVQRSLLVTAIALKRYQLQYGACPEALSALVPDYLRELPRDVMDGQPLRYRLLAEGSFLLYSVGENQVDDGGDASPTQTGGKAWTRAKDAVWPAPASVEEARAALATLRPSR